MTEDREKFKPRPIKEIYVTEATFMFPKEQLQESEDRVLKGVEEAQDEVKRTGQIQELKCYSSDPKERPFLGKYAVIKEVIINEVFKELGIKEEARRFVRGKDTITLWPTEKEGVFAQRKDGLFENRERYTKGILVAGPGKKLEDVAKEYYGVEIKEKKEE